MTIEANGNLIYIVTTTDRIGPYNAEEFVKMAEQTRLASKATKQKCSNKIEPITGG